MTRVAAIRWMAMLAFAAVHGLAFAGDAKVALKGHDPVAYFTDGKAVKGTTSISYDFDDGHYLFSNAAHRQMFASSPDRYTPQFGGLCASGLAMGMKAEADPTVWKIIDGKLYVFSSPQAREMVEKDPAILQRSREHWKSGK